MQINQTKQLEPSKIRIPVMMDLTFGEILNILEGLQQETPFLQVCM